MEMQTVVKIWEEVNMGIPTGYPKNSTLAKFAARIEAVEREECAKLAEAHFIFGHSVAGPHFAAALADKIRERSNAELRGRSDSDGPA